MPYSPDAKKGVGSEIPSTTISNFGTSPTNAITLVVLLITDNRTMFPKYKKSNNLDTSQLSLEKIEAIKILGWYII